MVNGVLTKQWLYRDQLKPVAELDGAGNLVSEFIFGTKANVPDLVIRGGVTYRIVSDQMGSPVLAINTANSSDVPFQATYSAWGEQTLVSGTDDWMPFGFAGGHFDPDAKLTRFGTRDYGAAIGRWTRKDGFRFRPETNVYVYSWNDPVNALDSNGLAPSYADCQSMADQNFSQCWDSCRSIWGAICKAVGFPLDSEGSCKAACVATSEFEHRSCSLLLPPQGRKGETNGDPPPAGNGHSYDAECFASTN